MDEAYNVAYNRFKTVRASHGRPDGPFEEWNEPERRLIRDEYSHFMANADDIERRQQMRFSAARSSLIESQNAFLHRRHGRQFVNVERQRQEVNSTLDFNRYVIQKCNGYFKLQQRIFDCLSASSTIAEQICHLYEAAQSQQTPQK